MLEARDRVGGRTLNHHVAEGRDRGDRRRVRRPDAGPRARAREVGRRRDLQDLQRGRQRAGPRRGAVALPGHAGLSPDPDFQEAILTSITKLNPMSEEVPVDAPWKAPKAEEWDKISLGEWRDQNITAPGARRLFDIAAEALWGAELRRADAAVRALVHRVRRQREEQGRLHAPDLDPRRRAGEPLRRRVAARPDPGGEEARLAGRAELAGAAHRAAPREGGRHVRPDGRRGERGDRRGPARSSCWASTSSRACRP